jgi:hypothetical protein
MTLDGSGTPSIYVNGVLIGTYPGSISNIPSPGTGFSIGSQWGIRYANMKCGNANFYSKALTSDEVQQNYQATKDKFLGQNIVTNGLVLNLDAANKDSYPGTGTTWTDLSGNANNGTLINGPSFLPSVNGGVISFDGVDDYISRSYNSTFNIRTGLTLSVFFKRNSIFTQLSDCFILSRVPSWYFYDSYNTGNIRGEVFIDGTRRGAVETPIPNDGNWYKVDYTYDSTTGFSRIYRNGSLWTSTQLTGLANYLIDSSNSNFSSIFFSNVGKSYLVSNLAIYNRALSATEVAQNYNAQKTRFGL